MNPELLDRAARIIANDRAEQDRRTVAEAAEKAYCAGGPSVEQIAEMIRADRVRRAA